MTTIALSLPRLELLRTEVRALGARHLARAPRRRQQRLAAGLRDQARAVERKKVRGVMFEIHLPGRCRRLARRRQAAHGRAAARGPCAEVFAAGASCRRARSRPTAPSASGSCARRRARAWRSGRAPTAPAWCAPRSFSTEASASRPLGAARQPLASTIASRQLGLPIEEVAAMDLMVNGRSHALPDDLVDPAMPLLWVLRDVLQLTGTKFGCGVAACGACTVHVDGKADALVRAAVGGARRQVGAHHRGARHAPRRRTRCSAPGSQHQVPQCGYCQSGMLMAAAALLAARARSERRRDRCGDHQHLPLRHLPAHPRGDPRRGAGAAARRRRSRPRAAGAAMRRRGFILGGLGAGAALIVGWGLLPPRGRLGARRQPAGGRRRGRPQRLDQDRAPTAAWCWR